MVRSRRFSYLGEYNVVWRMMFDYRKEYTVFGSRLFFLKGILRGSEHYILLTWEKIKWLQDVCVPVEFNMVRIRRFL